MRIVVGESDPASANMISLLLTEGGYHLQNASNGPAALKMIKLFQPHLALLEVKLPKLGGFDICRQVHRESNLPIIFLDSSPTADKKDCVLGLKLGGDDYIVAPFEPLELRARVDAVLRRSYRKTQHPPVRLTPRNIILDPIKCRAQLIDGRMIDLPPVEFRLLHYLMEHAGRVVSTSDILNRFWGETTEANHNLVAHYIRCLRNKIEQGSGGYQHIVTVRPKGYKFQM